MKKWGAIIVMSGIAPLVAGADEAGVYAAIDAGQSKFKDYCNFSAADYVALGVSGLTCGDTDTGYRVSLGYRANENFSGEIGYFDAGKVSANLVGVYLGIPYTALVSTKDKAWQFVAVGSLPLAERFSVFGKAGVSLWDVTTTTNATVTNVTALGNQSETGSDFLWGIGVKFDFNENIAIRAQYETSKAGKDDTTGRGSVEFLSAGLVYNF